MPSKRRARKVENENAEDDSKQQPPKSRFVRGKRGGLESLPRMPLDIIIEIMKYLKPLDLLHLARTSRDFRNFLMIRSASPFWKTARGNVEGLPDCPPHLSEPAYTNLVFDKHCHSCLRPGINNVIWALSVRYCQNCKATNLRECRGVGCLFSAPSCTSARLRYTIEKRGKRGRSYWHHELEIATLGAVIPSMDEKEIAALELTNKAIMEHAKLCDEWQHSAMSSRQEELDDIRAQRHWAILSKLKEHGYSEELDLMEQDGRLVRLKRHPLFNQPKFMTERIWLNGKDDILQFMKTTRELRLHRQRGVIYREWRRTHRDRKLLPLDVDILCAPDYVSAVNDSAHTSIDVTMISQDFAERAKQRRDRCDEELREKVMDSPELRESLGQDVDPLTLAVVAFSCTSCASKRLAPPLYPSVIVHTCCYGGLGDSSELVSGIDQDLASIITNKSGPHAPWSSNVLELGLWYRRAAEIIKACGEDPTTITREDMDALSIRLWCTCCSRHYSAGDIRQIMTWRDAFTHYTFHDRQNGKTGLDYANDDNMKYPLEWASMSGDDFTSIVAMEETLARTYYSDISKIGSARHSYCCAHCDDRVGIVSDRRVSFKTIIWHLNYAHNIIKPVEDDIYQHPDAEAYTTRPVLIIRCKNRRLKQEALDRQVAVIQKHSNCYAPSFSYDF